MIVHIVEWIMWYERILFALNHESYSAQIVYGVAWHSIDIEIVNCRLIVIHSCRHVEHRVAITVENIELVCVWIWLVRKAIIKKTLYQFFCATWSWLECEKVIKMSR